MCAHVTVYKPSNFLLTVKTLLVLLAGVIPNKKITKKDAMLINILLVVVFGCSLMGGVTVAKILAKFCILRLSFPFMSWLKSISLFLAPLYPTRILPLFCAPFYAELRLLGI